MMSQLEQLELGLIQQDSEPTQLEFGLIGEPTTEGYVLVRVKGINFAQERDRISSVPGVTKAVITAGEWDIIGRFELESAEEARSTVNAIRKSDGVKQTSTHIIIDKPSPNGNFTQLVPGWSA